MYREPLSKSVSIQEMRHMRDAKHMSNMEIAKSLDVSYNTVLRYLGPQGETVRCRGSGSDALLTDEMIININEMHRQGISINGISERLGIGWRTVKRHIKAKIQEQKSEAVDQIDQEDVAGNAPAEEVEKEMPDFSLEVVSRRQHVRLRGSDCEYEIETGGDSDSVTVINGTTEVIMFDKESLDRFINELQIIKQKYFCYE